MVKKLFKHELTYYLRSLLPIYIIVLAIATMSRIIQLFEADNTVYDILNGTSIGSFVISIIACFILTTVFMVVRYYRNLFTSEGYLTFTLPVTPNQLLWTKLLTATLVEIISLLVVGAALCIATAGDVLNEIVKAGVYLCNLPPQEWKNQYWLFILEMLLLVLGTILYQVLLFYTCITVGQMFHKNRVLAAVGVYFGYYIVTQIIGTVITVFAAFLPWEEISIFFLKHAIPCVHGIAFAGILLNAIIAAAFFLISHTIIRRKLNLE